MKDSKGIDWSNWSKSENDRRCDLIHKEIMEETITPEEKVELEQLQQRFLDWRKKNFPRDLETPTKILEEFKKKKEQGDG